MPLGVQQDVLGLQVPVDDVEGVEVAQGAGDLCGVEPGSGLQEAALSLKVVEQLEGKTPKKKPEVRLRDKTEANSYKGRTKTRERYLIFLKIKHS